MKKIAILLASLVLMSAAVTIVSAYDPYEEYGMDPEDAASFAVLGGIIGLACIAIWFILAIILMIWVYKDAEKRGSSGVLWLLIVLITGIIGLIIWLVVRPKDIAATGTGMPTSDRKCPNCGRNIPMDAKVCPYCGKDF